MKWGLHDTHTSCSTVARTVTLYHLSHAVQFNLRCVLGIKSPSFYITNACITAIREAQSLSVHSY